MTKSKWTRRAKHKVEGPSQGALIKADSFVESAIVVRRSHSARVAGTTLFNAELEEVIELIAKDRVYRLMLARLGRRLLVDVKANVEGINA